MPLRPFAPSPHLLLFGALHLGWGCATTAAPPAGPAGTSTTAAVSSVAPVPRALAPSSGAEVEAEAENVHIAACVDPAHHPELSADSDETAVAGAEAEELGDGEVAEEEEQIDAANAGSPELRYTGELSDEELAARWKNDLEALGSISVGFAHEGRLVNGVQFPEGDGQAWVVVSPSTTWGTQETVEYLTRVASHVKSAHPDAFPLRVNEMSAKEGGHLRPHRSHQNGRDVDLGFYYHQHPPPRVRERERVIAVDQNWSLVRALVTMTDVQVILLDRRVQEVLYDYALSVGEDRAWLDSLFKAGRDSLIQHAPRHRDHFHVRFYNPRAQELGRRVAPLLAQRPEQNLVSVRVRYGDTLSGIAVRYGSSVRAIQKANRMRNSFIKVSQVLRVPLFGPCNRCPVPPAVEVPPRRLPPEPTRVPISKWAPDPAVIGAADSKS